MVELIVIFFIFLLKKTTIERPYDEYATGGGGYNYHLHHNHHNTYHHSYYPCLRSLRHFHHDDVLVWECIIINSCARNISFCMSDATLVKVLISILVVRLEYFV